MSERKENDVQEAVEELLTDPDAPDKGSSTPPPQTIDAEPAEDR
ncbi:hypothetical protein [Sphingomonas sp. NPDC079357]